MQTSAESPALVRPLRREQFWNTPNAITVGRIVASPILMLAPWCSGVRGSALFGLFFLAVSLTDLLDGYLARRDNTVTRAGKLLDPLADKLLVATGLVLLVAMPERIPLWGAPLVVLILGRELAVTGLRAMASAEGVVLQAAPLGKWKTGLQTAAITLLIIHYPWLGLPLHEVGLVVLIVATVLTVLSGYVYFSGYLGSQDAP
jgi:CDP-diacylglycerol---glycerol-3-phosphate 3-phosphatidyltransferase